MKSESKPTIAVNSLIPRGDSLVSRAQAKRLITRFENSQEITLDFTGVSSIGQPFADEVFRVFCRNFPDTHLHLINVNSDIDKMIKHVLSN